MGVICGDQGRGGELGRPDCRGGGGAVVENDGGSARAGVLVGRDRCDGSRARRGCFGAGGECGGWRSYSVVWVDFCKDELCGSGIQNDSVVLFVYVGAGGSGAHRLGSVDGGWCYDRQCWKSSISDRGCRPCLGIHDYGRDLLGTTIGIGVDADQDSIV